MASEATKMVVIGNMHMDVRVIEVTELNSEVRSDLQGHYHCHPLVFRAIALQVLRYDTGSAIRAFFSSLSKKIASSNSKCNQLVALCNPGCILDWKRQLFAHATCSLLRP